MIYKRKFGDKAGQYLTDEDVDLTADKPVVPVRIYKRIAAAFLGLTIVLLGLMVYLSFSKAVITIIPAKEKTSLDFSLNVEKEPSSREAIAGTLVSVKVQGEAEETATGAYVAENRPATGEVSIINNTSSGQILIKTTRLLTPSGVLFRLNSTVSVPANGVAKVQIYADKQGSEGEIDPVKMTIPGLPSSLQSDIYAELSEATKIQSEDAVSISREDMNRVKEKLLAELLEKGEKELDKIAPENFSGKVFGSEIISTKYSGEEGEKAEKISLEMELRVIGVFYDLDAMQEIAKLKLEESISSESELLGVNYNEAKIDIGRIDTVSENANLKIYIDGDTVLKSTSQIFDKNKLAGMEKESAINYFKTFSAIESAQIQLSPFWLKQIPGVKDNIEIIIKK